MRYYSWPLIGCVVHPRYKISAPKSIFSKTFTLHMKEVDELRIRNLVGYFLAKKIRYLGYWDCYTHSR